ncbi:MAG: hypothetical protein AUG51_06150 [Acidobacteria bacterium 13_1_20CM_3_53_8]|nr:MAG: hypothetical protein AUG51_06150 [Acidobacteria bacterium 13_1_20CM_3_53_8]
MVGRCARRVVEFGYWPKKFLRVLDNWSAAKRLSVPKCEQSISFIIVFSNQVECFRSAQASGF